MLTKKLFITKNLRALLFFCVILLSSTHALAQSSQTIEEQPLEAPYLYALFSTSMGDFTVEFTTENSPITVANFIKYAKRGAYDNTIFHRVIRKFMVQGGGYTKDLKHISEDNPIINESRNRLSNTTGSIAMARGGNPHSASTEFFINVSNNESLNYRPAKPGYAVFGHVVNGMKVVFDISQQPTTRTNPFANLPVETITLKKVTLLKTLPSKPTEQEENQHATH